MNAFEALADPVRRDLLRALSSGELTAGDLVTSQPGSQPGVSRHLRRLREAGLVDVEQRGRHRTYTLRPEGLAPLDDFLAALRASDERPDGGLEPPVPSRALEGLDLEVRRTTRERRAEAGATRRTETA